MAELPRQVDVRARLEEPCYAFSLNLEDEASLDSKMLRQFEAESSARPDSDSDDSPVVRPPRARPAQASSASVGQLPTLMTSSWRSSSSSMPMMLASKSSHVRSLTSLRSDSQPLGSKWRDQDLDGTVRSNADDGSEFVQGCLPNWATERKVRSAAAVEHKLSWAYYHMRSMRVGLPKAEMVKRQTGQQFDFWRDLRPPFRVASIERDTDDTGGADGPLFRISYSCPLDYVTERKWGLRTSEEGTFKNTVHGVAEVRIPKDFPETSKHICVLSWGRPALKFGVKPQQKAKEVPAISVDPKTWSPVAAEFHLRSNCGRLAKLRDTLHQTNLKLAEERRQTRPWRRALLKPCATLADFVQAEEGANEYNPDSPKRDLRRTGPAPAASTSRGDTQVRPCSREKAAGHWHAPQKRQCRASASL
ncbi:unnamed protein product [Effrenium voratum]|nr:unnamed protein product [Effrenium voratum]